MMGRMPGGGHSGSSWSSQCWRSGRSRDTRHAIVWAYVIEEVRYGLVGTELGMGGGIRGVHWDALGEESGKGRPHGHQH